ncbi:MAG: hypothetical protein HY701_11650 [Gemmatimonadetes bacterium]|nr:hypothetical protein [Gemmatimonadota bacterium]
MFKTGYVLSRREDLFWFITLPFLAVLVALGFQHWLPYVAVASINLWITIPHHYATWVRTYGMPEEWGRFKDRLIIGPIVIMLLTAAGFVWAPVTMLLLVTAWDHQHSIMQQHGFGRIYDFKAGTGAPTTGRFDLALNWLLYGHMFVNAPMFRHLWIRELFNMHIEVSVEFVRAILVGSWVVLGGFLIAYGWHIWRTVRSGQAVNPVKYAFIGASYFLWYFTAWHTNSVLLYAVAHRIMHGVQYMVIVYFFLRRKAAQESSPPGLWTMLAGQGRLKWFLIAGGAYAVLFQLLINRPLDEFGFGVVNFLPYEAIPAFNIPDMDYAAGYALFSQTMISAYALTHYYVDSFIWKVRDK